MIRIVNHFDMLNHNKINSLKKLNHQENSYT